MCCTDIWTTITIHCIEFARCCICFYIVLLPLSVYSFFSHSHTTPPDLLPTGSAIGHDAAFVQLSVNATIGQPVPPGAPYIINTEYGSVDDCLVNSLLPTYYMAVYRNITCRVGDPNCMPATCAQTTKCATGTHSIGYNSLGSSLYTFFVYEFL